MKKIKLTRKLKLNKQFISELNRSQKDAIQGGKVGFTTESRNVSVCAYTHKECTRKEDICGRW